MGSQAETYRPDIQPVEVKTVGCNAPDAAADANHDGARFSDISDRERAKWDSYYGSLDEAADTPEMATFGAELAARVAEFLPAGGRVLEAGCGAGQQSMALARAGIRDLTLMDFSDEALGQARRWFGRCGVDARFERGDVLLPGEPEYDLVFNAGVLEHYTFDEQVRFLRGMASRSRRYVLALVPNRLCYWYWVSRLHASSVGAWPFGKEAPMVDLERVFEASGLTFHGQFFGGSAWSENFITAVPGLETGLRDLLLTIHRSPVIPAWQSSYLVGALGSHAERPALSTAWAPGWPRAVGSSDEATSALADALALAIAGEQRLATLRANAHVEAETQRAEIALHRAEIARLAALHADCVTRLDERERALRSLIAQNDELAAQKDSLAARNDSLLARSCELDARLDHERAKCATLEFHLTASRQAYDEFFGWSRMLETQLAEITSSQSWELVQRVSRTRRKFARAGSLVAGIGRFGLHAVRQACQVTMSLARRARPTRPHSDPPGEAVSRARPPSVSAPVVVGVARESSVV